MTTTDWRELCAELLDALNGWHQAVFETGPGWARPDETYLIDRARAALAQPDPALSQRPECFEFALDFLGRPENDQLLEYIERLEARAALAQPEPEVMGPTDQELADAFAEGCRDGSKAGEPPFLGGARAVLASFGHQPAPPAEGDVGELVAELRSTADGLESQAYPQTAALITRAADLLEQRQPAPAPVTEPTDEQLLATVDGVTVTLPPLPRDQADAHGRIEYDIAWRIAMARAVLARWGGQAAPVPVAERLPGPEDCDAEGRCWVGYPELTYSIADTGDTDTTTPEWRLEHQPLKPKGSRCCWLPATALPLPAGEVQP